MDLDLSAFARGVDPAAALAWWFDFREGGTDHAFLGVRVRRVILSRGGGVVEMEDRAPLFRERVRAERRAASVVFAGENTLSRFRGEYRFDPEAGGTRIRLVASIDLRGVLKLGGPVARATARGILQRDLAGHVEDLVAAHGQGGLHTG